MTLEEKWKLHYRAEAFNGKCDSSAIKRKMTKDERNRHDELVQKYTPDMKTLDKYFLNGVYGVSFIKLAIRAPRMSDDEALFVKHLLDEHM